MNESHKKLSLPLNCTKSGSLSLPDIIIPHTSVRTEKMQGFLFIGTFEHFVVLWELGGRQLPQLLVEIV